MAKPIEKTKPQKDTKGSKDAKSKKTEPKSLQEQIWSWTKTIVGAIIVVTILNGLAIASFVVPTPSMERTVMTGDFLFVNKFIYGPSTPQVIPFVNLPLPFFRFPGIRNPERGDVIVFIFPGNRDEVEASEFQYYLKRCVAIGGDTLAVKDKKLFVNGKEVPMAPNAQYDETKPITQDETWQTFPKYKGYTRDNYGPIRIPKKGDVIQLTPDNLVEWSVFIAREGHNATSTGTQVFIDGKAANTYTVAKDYCFGMGDNRDHSLDSRYWGFIPVENVVGTPMIVYWSWDTNLTMAKLIDKITSIRWSRIFTIIR
jgi:signal peptidase I